MTPAERRRRVRGWILQLLAQEPVGPDGAHSQLRPERLQELLFVAGFELSVEEVRGECGYLAQKKLVEVEQFRGTAGKLLGGLRTGVRLLAAGTDIIESTTTDPGIDLGIFRD